MKKRERWLDIVKAIAVSAVVFHHAGFPVLFLNMVFVSVFFVTSGYVFKEQPLRDFLIKQVKRLWIPFVAANILILLGHNLLTVMGLWTGEAYSIKELLQLTLRAMTFSPTDALSAPHWFVFMILASNAAFYLLYYLTKWVTERAKAGDKLQDVILGVTSLLLFIAGVIFTPFLNKIVWGNSTFLTNVCFGMILYYIGYAARKYDLVNRFMRIGRWPLLVIFIGITVCLMFVYAKLGYIADHRAGNFTHPLLLPIVTLMGFIWMLLLAKGLIEKIPYIGNMIDYIGQQSLYVMLFHGLAFQIITIIQVKICHIPYDPAWVWQNIYMGSGLWVTLAGLTGTAVPVLIRWAYCRLFRRG